MDVAETTDSLRAVACIRSPSSLPRWIILGTPLSKPPPDIGAIEPDIRGATTIREQLDKHRNVESRARCHVEIDPPGFALESFDVTDGWRDHYRAIRDDGSRRFVDGPPVNSGGVLPDGRHFENIDDYKKLLLANKDQLARNLAGKLLAYSEGAPPPTAGHPGTLSGLSVI